MIVRKYLNRSYVNYHLTFTCKFGKHVHGNCGVNCTYHHICILNIGAAHYVFDKFKFGHRLNRIQKLLFNQLTQKLHYAATTNRQVLNISTELLNSINENLSLMMIIFSNESQYQAAHEARGAYLVPKHVYRFYSSCTIWLHNQSGD